MPTRSPWIKALFYTPFPLLSKGVCLLGMVLLVGGSLLGSNPAHAQLFGPDGQGVFGPDGQVGGRSAHAGPEPPIGELWSAEVKGTSVVIGENGTAVFSTGESLVALGPDGKERWRTDAPGSIFPQETGTGTVYFMGERKQSLHARTFSGSEKWTFDLQKLEGTYSESRVAGGVVSPVAGADGTIYVVTKGKKGVAFLHAIGPDGTKKWTFQPTQFSKQFNVSSASRGSPPPVVVGENGTVYVIASPASGPGETLLLAIRSEGKEKWRIEGDTGLEQVMIGNDGTVYPLTHRRHRLFAIGPDGNGKWAFEHGKWAFEREHHFLSPPAFGDDGTIYVSSAISKKDTLESHLHALNPDGTEKWAWRLEKGVIDDAQPPSFGPNGVYVYSKVLSKSSTEPEGRRVTKGKYLHAVTPEGKEKWRKKRTSTSRPVIDAEGTVYVAEDSLYAFSPDGTEKWHFDKEFGPYLVIVNETIYAVGSDALYAIGTVED